MHAAYADAYGRPASYHCCGGRYADSRPTYSYPHTHIHTHSDICAYPYPHTPFPTYAAESSYSARTAEATNTTFAAPTT
ncbi:MAG: hypothetical protein HYU29_00430 [Chloroflexi bacterium]|nr:hypothetical protein [Chloroflexota bacterium]